MNDFTSTCSQLVTTATCNGALNPVTYINSLCFIQVNILLLAFYKVICISF